MKSQSWLCRVALGLTPLPAFAALGDNGSITLRVDVDAAGAVVSAHAHGRTSHWIDDNERSSFGLSDDGVKPVFASVLGRVPDSIHARPPTPWDWDGGHPWDRYPANGNRPVSLVIEPGQGRVLPAAVEHQVLATRHVSNPSQTAVRLCEGLSSTVEDSAWSSWSTAGGTTFRGDIKVEIGGIGDVRAQRFPTSWGKQGRDVHSIPHAISAKACICAAPGRNYRFDLTASRTRVRLEQDYGASPAGAFLANYDPTYRGHHWYFLGAPMLLESLGRARALDGVQTLELSRYVDPAIEVHDEAGQARQLASPFGGGSC